MFQDGNVNASPTAGGNTIQQRLTLRNFGNGLDEISGRDVCRDGAKWCTGVSRWNLSRHPSTGSSDSAGLSCVPPQEERHAPPSVRLRSVEPNGHA